MSSGVLAGHHHPSCSSKWETALALFGMMHYVPNQLFQIPDEYAFLRLKANNGGKQSIELLPSKMYIW